MKDINSLKIVVIGGGTGTYTLLQGLKNYFKNITAIVTSFDSGGSSGVLRDEFGYLPPGDVRRAILALIPQETNEIFRKLLDYRFKKGNGLSGHNFGNLFLTALSDITGSEVNAIKELSKLLKLKGQVLPVSTTNSNLYAKLINGDIIKGETNIDIPKNYNEFIKIKEVYLEPQAHAYDQSIIAINNADIVIIGPGDLYTSLIPNLITQGISDSLKKTNAKKIYICNVMSKFSETHGYKSSDYLKEILKYTDINYMIVNNKEINNLELLNKYASENAYPVIYDSIESKLLNVEIIEDDVISESLLIRHDQNKLSKTVLKLVIDLI